MEAMEMTALYGSGASNFLQFSIDILAAVIGLFAVLVVIRLNRRLGGKISKALTFFILGVFCNILAIVWSVFFGHVFLVGGMNFNLHQNLMSLGMIFFIVSTTKFSKLV